MFDKIVPAALGAAGVGVVYFLYLAATKGLPAALAWFKAKWNAGKADLANLQGDVAGVQTKVASIETVALAGINKRLADLELAVKGQTATPAAAPPAPAPQPAAPVAG